MEETELHIRAFEAYYAMGKRRSIRQLSREFKPETHHATLSRWAKKWDWKKRVYDRDHTEEATKGLLTEAKAQVDLLVREDVIPVKLALTIKKVSDSLDQFFTVDGEGKVHPTFEVEKAGDFKSMVSALADLIHLRDEFIDTGEKHKGKVGAGGDQINNFFFNLNQEERIAIVTGVFPNERRDREVEGRVEEISDDPLPRSKESTEDEG